MDVSRIPHQIVSCVRKDDGLSTGRRLSVPVVPTPKKPLEDLKRGDEDFSLPCFDKEPVLYSYFQHETKCLGPFLLHLRIQDLVVRSLLYDPREKPDTEVVSRDVTVVLSYAHEVRGPFRVVHLSPRLYGSGFD